MTIAVRIARASSGKDNVVFCGYHDWHDWYLSANLGTENALGEYLLSGLEPNGVPKGLKVSSHPFHYNNLEELETIARKYPKDLGVIVIEAIRNDPPTNEFRKGIREIADRTGAILIVDEISSGFRLNTGGAHLKYSIQPDMAVFSKALGNGYAIAAIIGKEEIMQATQSTFISSTNWTERVGPVAALATIRKHKKVNAGKHLVAMGRKIQQGWKKSAEKAGLPIEVGGIPPLSHFAFKHESALEMKAYFIQLMLEKNILSSTLYYSMLAHIPDNITSYVEHLENIFSEIKSKVDDGSIKLALCGKKSEKGFGRLT